MRLGTVRQKAPSVKNGATYSLGKNWRYSAAMNWSVPSFGSRMTGSGR
jgi:hypothetical protein